MRRFLQAQSTTIIEYDEKLIRRLAEKTTVYDNKLTIEFKSCVEIDID